MQNPLEVFIVDNDIRRQFVRSLGMAGFIVKVEQAGIVLLVGFLEYLAESGIRPVAAACLQLMEYLGQ